jgi:hypothetical protein
MPFSLKRGNLVQNGGFEQGLAGWLGAANVGIVPSALSHSGMIAAAMGKPDGTAPADILQDVPALPRRTYKCQFFVAGVRPGPADLSVDIRWMCAGAGDAGCALECGPVLVRGVTIGPAALGAWKAVIAYTDAAPPGAEAARIVFSKGPGTAQCNYLLVDDVIFVERD